MNAEAVRCGRAWAFSCSGHHLLDAAKGLPQSLIVVSWNALQRSWRASTLQDAIQRSR